MNSPMMSGKARVAGVMGWPVQHSLSPRLHGYWLRTYGIDGAYVPLSVSPEGFGEAVRGLAALGFVGANVTVPHKEAAFAAVNTRTPRAERVSAVNTIVVDDQGSLTGDNTDGFGFLENLKAGCPTWEPEAFPALVIGAGGAARGIVAALLDAGVPAVTIANRTVERAEAISQELGERVQATSWEGCGDAIAHADLVVNATTLGMEGSAPLSLDLSALPRTSLVTDIVYTPLETPLLSWARARGNPVVDGLGMLLHQARPGFRAWFGVDPEVTDELRRFVLEGLRR